MTKIQSILVFIAAAVIIAAAVTLTNFAQAEVTGKAVPPTNGMCPAVGQFQDAGVGSWSDTPPLSQIIVCESTIDEYGDVARVAPGETLTLTTSANLYVLEGRLSGGAPRVGVSRVIARNTNPPPPPPTDPAPNPTPDPMTPPDDGNNGTPATVQAKSSNDAKRLAQYGAAGFAAFVLIHNYWLGAPLGVLPLNMAYNDKGAIFSGTSFRITPQETIHLSALESLDDKRGEYKFGVQWHYQFAPPRGLTETPQAALPAIYTMPNVTPKDWLNE